jgi:hypothetical protein
VRREETVATVGAEAPIGGHKAAARLAERTALAGEKWDVEALADVGALAVAGWYMQWPLYSCRRLDAVDVEQLAAVVAEQQAWMTASVSKWDAPARLGWHQADFEKVAKERGLQLGRLERYAITDLDMLAGDEELAEQIRRDRLFTTHQAAEVLEIRETDFRWLVAADLAVPVKHTWVEITRYRDVSVPLYRRDGVDSTDRAGGHDRRDDECDVRTFRQNHLVIVGGRQEPVSTALVGR